MASGTATTQMQTLECQTVTARIDNIQIRFSVSELQREKKTKKRSKNFADYAAKLLEKISDSLKEDQDTEVFSSSIIKKHFNITSIQ